MAIKTTAQKIAESKAAFKGRQTETKIKTSQNRKEERKITPERRQQIEAAARSTNVRAQQTKSRASRSSDAELKKANQLSAASAEFRSQLKSGFGARTVLNTQTGETKKQAPKSTVDNVGPNQLNKEVGSIDAKKGPTPEQQKAIAAIEEFNKNFKTKQDEAKKKTDVQEKRGDFTDGDPVDSLFGSSEKTDAFKTPILEGVLDEDSPDVFKDSAALASNTLSTEFDVAKANLTAKEKLREQQLRSQLSKLSLGDEGSNVLQAAENQLGQLSLPQLEQLALVNGLELTDDLKEKLSRNGKSAIETEKITKEERLAENEYSKNQLSRQYDRAITDREEFNVQQDAKLRRLVATFGGGKASTIGSNVAVMKEVEKGVKAVADLRADYSDKTLLVSQRADAVIKTYGNNVQIIQSKMADAIENKYAEITNTIDDLLDAGITNELELNNAILTAKKDYAKSYSEISEKAYTAIQDQNQRLFENDIANREIKIKENKDRQTSFFTDSLGLPVSTETTNTQNMTPIQAGDNGDNCVLFCRDQVTNLPLGLFNKADKQRAIQSVGFRDPGEVRIGDAILTAEGEYGHAAVVQDYDKETGIITLQEANYVPGAVTQGRTMQVNDNKIYGFIHPDTSEPTNNGGNANLEGTNQAIESQVKEASGQFIPQNRGEQLALQLARGEVDALDLSRMGATKDDIAQLQFVADQISDAGLDDNGLLEDIGGRLEIALQGQTSSKVKDSRKSISEAIKSGNVGLAESIVKDIEIDKWGGRVKEPVTQFNKDILDFKDVRDKNSKIETVWNEYLDGNAQPVFVDQALISLFNKITDPASVVRESEFNRTAESLGILDRVRALPQKIKEGGAGLTDQNRADLVMISRALTEGGERKFISSRNTALNKTRGLNVPDQFTFSQLGLNDEGTFGILTGQKSEERIPVDIEDMKLQLKNPTSQQLVEINLKKEELRQGEQLVIRNLKFTAINPEELLPTDIKL